MHFEQICALMYLIHKTSYFKQSNPSFLLFTLYVRFKYRKVGKQAKINAQTGVVAPEVIGEIRAAWSMLNPAIAEHTIEQVEAAEKKRHIPNDTAIVYFDRDAVYYRTGQQGAYRCFKKTLFEGRLD